MPDIEHLAIIMDGNGRWAANNNKPRKEGHKAGALKVREITKFCTKLDIKYLTLYAFSTENWKRPKLEVDFLMKLLEKYLKDEEENYIKNNICFNFIGDISIFSQSLQSKLYKLKDKTKCNTNLTQVLALNYGSQDEISRAVVKICKQGTHLGIDLEKLDKLQIKKLIEQNLDTNMPPVDALIRTGGEYRLSNFLLWQVSYAELFFTPTLWPDFSLQELEDILQSFKLRQRRFGGI